MQRNRSATDNPMLRRRTEHRIRLPKTQLVVLVVTLVTLELALQAAWVFSLDVRRVLAPPWQTHPRVLSDRQLTYRGNPLHPQADAAGYRNPTRPAQSDIVALGDSQTYGPENRDDAWPLVLGRRVGRSAYNMALPGYGPLQAYLQLDEALDFQPTLIVVAPYFGNDFYETFLLVEQRDPEFASWISPQLAEEVKRAERTQPIRADIGTLIRESPTDDRAPDRANGARRWLSEHVRLYGLVRALKHRIAPAPVTPLLSRKLETAAQAVTPEVAHLVSVFDGGEWRTILAAPYRNRVLDDRDPRIRAGFEVAREAIRRMAQRCKAAGVAFLVVLIPTKEMALYQRVKNPAAHPQLEQLAANETRVRREWIADLQAHGIRHVDALIPLAGAPAQPYYEDFDGHPTAFGHRLIAAEVARHLADR